MVLNGRHSILPSILNAEEDGGTRTKAMDLAVALPPDLREADMAALSYLLFPTAG